MCIFTFSHSIPVTMGGRGQYVAINTFICLYLGLIFIPGVGKRVYGIRELPNKSVTQDAILI